MTRFENQIDDDDAAIQDMVEAADTDETRALFDHAQSVRDLSEVADWLTAHPKRAYSVGEWVEFQRVSWLHSRACRRLAGSYDLLYAMRLYDIDVKAYWPKVEADHETGRALAVQNTEGFARLWRMPPGVNRLADAVAGVRA